MQALWNSVASVLGSQPIVTFLLGILATLFAHRLTAYWSRVKSIDETKLKIFMSWMPDIAEWYVEALSSEPTIDLTKFQKKKWEILDTLQIMGPIHVILAFAAFSDSAEMAFKRDPEFNSEDFKTFHNSLNYCLCCEIHREKLNAPLRKRIKLLVASLKGKKKQ